MSEAELKNLAAQRETMEKEIIQLTNKINAINEVENYEKGLVDSEGFPRADLDFGKLSDYRLMKRRRNELQNDYADLMKKIEKGLIDLHQEYSQNGQAQKEMEQYEADQEKKREYEKKQLELIKQNEEIKKLKEAKEKKAQQQVPIPFVSVSEVVESSPADQDVLKEFVLMIQFPILEIQIMPFLMKLDNSPLQSRIILRGQFLSKF